MFIRNFVYLAKCIILIGAGSILPSIALAQSGDTDVGEIAVSGGGTLGIGAHPAVKGSAGVAFSRYGMALFQTSFSPLGSETIQRWPAGSTVERSHVLDFGVDFHIRVPIRERWAPYGIVGAGLLWDMVRQHAVDSLGVTRTIHYDQLNGALHTGAGLRYYVGKNWGIRPELEVIVSHRTYTQLTVGIFYVTPTEWP